MKKIVCLLLLFVLLLSAVACSGGGFDYRTEDLSGLVTLAPYLNEVMKAKYADLAAEITDDEVKEAINEDLEGKLAYYKKITDAVDLENGDTIGLTYKGVLVSTLETAGYSADGKTDKDGNALTAEQIKGLAAISGSSQTTTLEYVIGLGVYNSTSAKYEAKYAGVMDAGLAELKVGAKNAPIKVTFPKDYSDSALPVRQCRSRR